jgi:FMN phosphatase YigB (HAD superfamily)
MTTDLGRFKYLVFDVYGTLVVRVASSPRAPRSRVVARAQDWETGIYTALQPLLERAGKQWSRAEALTAYMAVESDLQAQYPDLLYADLLARVHDALAHRFAGAPSAPEPSGSTVAIVETSTGAAGSSVAAGTSAAGSSASAGGSSGPAAGSGAPHSDDGAVFGASIGAWQPFPDSTAALAKLSALGLKLVVLSNVDKASFARTRALLEQGFTFDHVFTAEEIGSYK